MKLKAKLWIDWTNIENKWPKKKLTLGCARLESFGTKLNEKSIWNTVKIDRNTYILKVNWMFGELFSNYFQIQFNFILLFIHIKLLFIHIMQCTYFMIFFFCLQICDFVSTILVVIFISSIPKYSILLLFILIFLFLSSFCLEFLFFWGVVFFITTTIIGLLKHEEDNHGDHEMGVVSAYKQFSQILRLPIIKKFLVIVITSKVKNTYLFFSLLSIVMLPYINQSSFNIVTKLSYLRLVSSEILVIFHYNSAQSLMII